MLTEFGKFCRKLRIDKNEKLSDMATRLGVSDAFLSSVEHGRKIPPADWKIKFPKEYQLSGELLKEFHRCLFFAINNEKIDISNFSEEDKTFLRKFVQKYPELNETAISVIQNLLDGVEEDYSLENSNYYPRNI